MELIKIKNKNYPDNSTVRWTNDRKVNNKKES